MGLPNDSPRDLRVADCPDKFTGARDLQQRPVHLVGIAGPGRASGPGSGWDVAIKEVPAPIWPQLAPPSAEQERHDYCRVVVGSCRTAAAAGTRTPGSAAQRRGLGAPG